MLQFIILIALVGVLASCRSFDRTMWAHCFNWRYIALAQFYIYFFLNAALYPVWDGVREHARAIALESWFLGLIGLFVLSIVRVGDVRFPCYPSQVLVLFCLRPDFYALVNSCLLADVAIIRDLSPFDGLPYPC